MKSLVELILNESFKVDQSDLKKVKKVLTDKNFCKKMDKKHDLPEGMTEYYCNDRLSRFSDPEWYENFFEDDDFDKNNALALKDAIMTISDWDGEDFLGEISEIDQFSDFNTEDNYFNVRDMVDDVLTKCLDMLK